MTVIRHPLYDARHMLYRVPLKPFKQLYHEEMRKYSMDLGRDVETSWFSDAWKTVTQIATQAVNAVVSTATTVATTLANKATSIASNIAKGNIGGALQDIATLPVDTVASGAKAFVDKTGLTNIPVLGQLVDTLLDKGPLGLLLDGLEYAQKKVLIGIVIDKIIGPVVAKMAPLMITPVADVVLPQIATPLATVISPLMTPMVAVSLQGRSNDLVQKILPAKDTVISTVKAAIRPTLDARLSTWLKTREPVMKQAQKDEAVAYAMGSAAVFGTLFMALML
jgi:hypothetical protein